MPKEAVSFMPDDKKCSEVTINVMMPCTVPLEPRYVTIPPE